MRYVYAAIMLICSVIAFFYATRVLYNQNYKKSTYRLFTLLSISSGVWSLGYGVMFWLDDFEQYARFRTLGILGIMMFMISGQVILSIMADTLKKLWWLILLEFVVGIYVLVKIVNPTSFTMEKTPNGIITAFTTTALSLEYTIYCLAIAGVFVAISIDMTRPKNSMRVRAFGRSFLKVEGLIGIGMIIDTVLPALGINPNIPASTIFQFFGLEIVYYAVHKLNRNLISMENMTGYIYDSFKAPVLVFDAQNGIRLFNNKATQMFDIRKDDIGKCNFWEHFFEMEAPRKVAEISKTLVIDATNRRSNIPCRLSVDPIFDEYKDYIGYIVSVTDMTEQIKAMKEIEQAKNEAEYANRAKSMFLANMSHEIRTPMNSILGFSELALRGELEDETRSYFSDIKQSAEVLLSTINDILDISKLETGKMELVEAPYETVEVLKEVSTIIEMQAASKNLVFSMEVSEDFPRTLLGDKGRIREILINLLNNGIKYTREGSVQLIAKVLTMDEKNARLLFAVKDTGMGIKEEDLSTIFDSFKRVDLEANRKTEGTGLGLSITKAFTELMGGQISVESTYGEGSTFFVEVPQEVVDSRSIDWSQRAPQKREEDNRNLLQGIRLLAVDDTMMNLKVISNVLQLYGGQVDTATDGQTAIDMCSKNQYQIVFMDHMMPGMDGVEAMEHIRRLGNGYELGGANKIIALTANALNGVREEMLSQGFDDYLKKPIEFELLEQVLKNIISAPINTETNSSAVEDCLTNEEQGLISLSERFPSLDVATGLSYCGEMEAFYLEILQMVVDSGRKDCDALLGFYEKENYKDFTIKVHGMKSQCYNIGASYMGDFAKKLEFAAKDQEYEVIQQNLDSFISDYMKLVDEIEKGLYP